MLIPDYWEEARRVVRRPDGRQRTIRRWGWSLESPEAARQHADQRVAEAAERFLNGDDVPGRIARKAYGDGETPIREEIIARFDRHVLTRNLYGATCLNTPDAAFADIDIPEPPGCVVGVCVALSASAAGVAAGIWMEVPLEVGALMILTVLPAALIGFAAAVITDRIVGDPSDRARGRVEAFAAGHPDWTIRLYETPNGFRTLVTHRPLQPNSQEVDDMFKAFGTDPMYAKLCRRQKCFRARLTPKPWRMGIEKPLRPRRGVYPFDADYEDHRRHWQKEYDDRATEYAACRLVGVLGDDLVHPDLESLVRLHDKCCGADTDLPIA